MLLESFIFLCVLGYIFSSVPMLGNLAHVLVSCELFLGEKLSRILELLKKTTVVFDGQNILCSG